VGSAGITVYFAASLTFHFVPIPAEFPEFYFTNSILIFKLVVISMEPAPYIQFKLHL